MGMFPQCTPPGPRDLTRGKIRPFLSVARARVHFDVRPLVRGRARAPSVPAIAATLWRMSHWSSVGGACRRARGLLSLRLRSKVKRNMIFLVEAPTTVFKLVTIARKLNKGCDLDFAASLLHHAGMLAICSWKKPGAVGYPGQLFHFLHDPGREGGIRAPPTASVGCPQNAPLVNRGPLGALLRPSWAFLWLVLGLSWAVLRPRAPVGSEKARISSFLRFRTDCSFPGVTLGGPEAGDSSWALLNH
eukprot:6663974-Pyramimonas_sp.AAC.1